MLFPYTYVPHQMERMQRFINFIFYQVWCRALKAGPYDLSLFDANPPLKELMTSFAYDHTAAGDRFSSQVEAIYQSFAQISRRDIAQFKRWFQANNSIDKICSNAPAVQLALYADITAVHKDLGRQLAEFFKGLYSQSLLDLAAVRAKIGDIDDHYKAFVQTNKGGKCPFCGISDLLGEYHSKREAYDHYLPKSLYPFNSINFRNLVPACHHCNSSYKTSKNPAYSPKDPARAAHRRKVFYPYRTKALPIGIAVTILGNDLAELAPEHIDLQFSPVALTEEIETWRDVYGIDERYKAKCCSNDARDWFEQIRIFRDDRQMKPEVYLSTLKKQTAKDRYANCNFLKEAFLEGCQKAGLFAVM